MEALAMDGSTLPALKDIFPEHFFEQAEHALESPQPGAILPQMSSSAAQFQDAQQQRQNIGTSQQDIQLPFNNGTSNDAYEQQFPTKQPRGRGGKRGAKRSYDASNASSHPQPQVPYFLSMDPSGQMDPFSASMDVHSHLPGIVQPQQNAVAGEGEGDEDADGPDDGEKRRHPCPRCGKRFNRPSSLKIHLNTHTGAKPYACPFQGCGRTFNVSSNMRRHFRNHAKRPPPPPLPPNNVYPISDQPSQQQTSRGRGRPPQRNPSFSQHQPPQMTLGYDSNVMFRGDSPNHSTAQLYPPSSDMRNSKASEETRQQQQYVAGALMTPPYTNEGSEYDPDDPNQVERNLFSQFSPYGTFSSGPGPGHQTSPNQMFPMPHMSMQNGMSGMPMGLGMPIMSTGMAMGTGLSHSDMFPIDPTLAGSGQNNSEAEADGEADADGELDPDADAEGEGETDIQRDADQTRRFGPSTSNARASSNPKTELGQRLNNTNVATGNRRGNLAETGIHFQQMVVPIPSHVPHP